MSRDRTTRHSSTLPQLPQQRPSLPKRAVDVVAAATALVVTAPILLVAALAVWLESEGSVLQTSWHVGADHRCFRMFAFRTVRSDAVPRLEPAVPLDLCRADRPAPVGCRECAQLHVEAAGTDRLASCSRLLVSAQGELICEAESHGQSTRPAPWDREAALQVTRVGRFLRTTGIDELPQILNVLRGDMSLRGDRPLPLHEAEPPPLAVAALEITPARF